MNWERITRPSLYMSEAHSGALHALCAEVVAQRAVSPDLRCPHDSWNRLLAASDALWEQINHRRSAPEETYRHAIAVACAAIRFAAEAGQAPASEEVV